MLSFSSVDFCHHLSPRGLPTACVGLLTTAFKTDPQTKVVLDTKLTSFNFCSLLELGSAILHLTFRSPNYSKTSLDAPNRCICAMKNKVLLGFG